MAADQSRVGVPQWWVRARVGCPRGRVMGNPWVLELQLEATNGIELRVGRHMAARPGQVSKVGLGAVYPPLFWRENSTGGVQPWWRSDGWVSSVTCMPGLEAVVLGQGYRPKVWCLPGTLRPCLLASQHATAAEAGADGWVTEWNQGAACATMLCCKESYLTAMVDTHSRFWTCHHTHYTFKTWSHECCHSTPQV